MVHSPEPWRSRDAGGSQVSTIQPYTLDKFSSQCFARTNKMILIIPLERIHTSTQLPEVNGASTRSLSAERTQPHKCKKRQFSYTSTCTPTPANISHDRGEQCSEKLHPNVASNCSLRITVNERTMITPQFRQ